MSTASVLPPANKRRLRWREGRPAPGAVVTQDETPAGTQQFQTSASFLASLVLHLILLVVLALISWRGSGTSALTLTVGESVAVESIAFELLNADELDDPLGDAGSLANKIVPLELFETAEITPPGEQIAVLTTKSSENDTPSAEQLPTEQAAVTFFGTHGYGNEFVFVLDVSGSMLSGDGGRIRRARAELIRSINQLQPEHSFYVVMYCSYTILMFGDRSPGNLIPATRENKQRAIRWINAVQPQGGTQPGGALMFAGNLRPDAVFFLSDGEFIFERPPNEANAVDQFIFGFGQARSNRFRPGLPPGVPYPKEILEGYDQGIVVNTIALESVQASGLMRQIAESKSGEFRFIPATNRTQFARRRR